MGKRNRLSDNPKRRVVDPAHITDDQMDALLMNASYVGSGHHKRNPGDYGLERTNPRPTKSLCDLSRAISLEEAKSLLQAGIRKKMISVPLDNGFPKYIWSVSDSGEAFEAKSHQNTLGMYHGYPLEGEDDMREYVLKMWAER